MKGVEIELPPSQFEQRSIDFNDGRTDPAAATAKQPDRSSGELRTGVVIAASAKSGMAASRHKEISANNAGKPAFD